jgi:DNA-binding NarL/FixJ family response regulator
MGEQGVRVAIVSDDYFAAVGFTHELKNAGIDEVINLSPSADHRCDLSAVPDCAVIDAADEHPESFAHLLEWAKQLSCPVLIVFKELRSLWVDVAMELGALGVLSRQQARDHLPIAVRALAAGQKWIPPVSIADRPAPTAQLSAREAATLALYCDGYKLASIARRMQISESTVSTYLARIRDKYNALSRPVHTRLELRQEAIKDGYIRAT